jgi:lipopolysaccharide transport system permease protein
MRAKSATNPFAFLWRHRRLILHTVGSDVRGRYTGSILGPYWALLSPVLLLGVYVLVYVAIFNVRVPGARGEGSALEYTFVIFAGLIPWFGFSESTSASVLSVVGNPHLLHNTSFPAPVLPVKAVLSSMVGQTIGLTVLLAALTATQHASVFWAFVPLAFVAQVLFSLGLAWILSVLNVFIRDLGQALSAILLLLMFVSPIAFTTDFIHQPALRLLLFLNPLSYLINLYRVPLVYGRPPALWDLVGAFSVALVTFWLGFRFFVRIRPYLADHV